MYGLKAELENVMEFVGVFWSSRRMIRCKDNYVICDAPEGGNYGFLWIGGWGTKVSYG